MEDDSNFGFPAEQELPEPWYSARCVFRWNPPENEGDEFVYEERVVLLKADDFDAAVAQAQEEAETYALLTGAEFTGFIDVYHVAEKKLEEGVEVFSLLRRSPLNEEDYLSRHFDTGGEFRE